MDLRTLPAFRPLPYVQAPSILSIRILFFPDTPFVHTQTVNPTCESGNFWPTALQSGNFWIRYFSNTCGRSNPDTFESDDVARSGPVFTVVSPAWLQNNMAANQNVFAVLVGLRVLGKTPKLYSRLSLKFYILYTLFVGVRPRHRSKKSSQTGLLSFLCVFCLCCGILQAIKRNTCTWRRQKTSRCSTRIQTCRQRRG